MARFPQLLFPLLTAGLVAAGCSSPRTALDQQEQRLAAELGAQWAETGQPAVREIAWPEAVALLREQNLELRRQRDAVITARERLRQVSKDLLPGAALTGNVTKALTQLGDLNGDDASLSLYAFLNVPGLVQWRIRHYGAELELIRAGWMLELKTRELTIQLRELYLRAALLEQRRANLALAEPWQGTGPLPLTLDTTSPALEREGTLWGLRREEDVLQSAIAELLGDSAPRWRLSAAGLPAFTYVDSSPALEDTARFGRLYRQLQAADLEGARLRQRGVKLRYWPDLTLNLSGPPLYQVSGGHTPGISADQVFVTLGSSVNLDLHGAIAQQLRETKRDFALLEAQLREQNARTLQGLRQARDALALNTRRLQLTESRLDALRGLPGTFNPARARENLERLLALDQQRTSLLLERTQLEALFWILDETQWPQSA
jgi:outer membrane protein TolC